MSGWIRIGEGRDGIRTPRSSGVAGRIRIRGKKGGRRTPRSSSVSGWIRIRGKKRGDDEMPTVVQGEVPDPQPGKEGSGAERTRNDG